MCIHTFISIEKNETVNGGLTEKINGGIARSNNGLIAV